MASIARKSRLILHISILLPIAWRDLETFDLGPRDQRVAVACSLQPVYYCYFPQAIRVGSGLAQLPSEGADTP